MYTKSIILPGEINEDIMKAFRFRYDAYIEELAYIESKYIYDTLKMEFDEYDQDSAHFLIMNGSGAVAYARVIHEGEHGLPVLNKLNAKDIFANHKRVEVSRMIIHKDYRFTKLVIDLYREIFLYLSKLEPDTMALADTFEKSNSCEGLKKIGFQQSNLEYMDTSFLVKEKSVLLYMQTKDMKSI